MSSVLDYIPCFQIEDQYYKYRRLGLVDVPEIIEMVGLLTTEGFQHLQIRLSFLKELASMAPGDAHGMLGMLTMAFGVKEIKDKFLEFISRTLRKTDAKGKKKGDFVSLDELHDPEMFPGYSLVYLVLYLVLHPDTELLRNAVEQGTSLPFFQRALDELADSSQEELKETLTTLKQSTTDSTTQST